MRHVHHALWSSARRRQEGTRRHADDVSGLCRHLRGGLAGRLPWWSILRDHLHVLCGCLCRVRKGVREVSGRSASSACLLRALAEDDGRQKGSAEVRDSVSRRSVGGSEPVPEVGDHADRRADIYPSCHHGRGVQVAIERGEARIDRLRGIRTGGLEGRGAGGSRRPRAKPSGARPECCAHLRACAERPGSIQGTHRGVNGDASGEAPRSRRSSGALPGPPRASPATSLVARGNSRGVDSSVANPDR